MRENRQSGSEGGGAKPIVSPYPYPRELTARRFSGKREPPPDKPGASSSSFHTSPVAPVGLTQRNFVTFSVSQFEIEPALPLPRSVP